MTNLKQLEPIRRQAAMIKAYINHLQSLRGFTSEQAGIIESARIAFNKIIALEIRDKRRAAGDDKPNKLEEIDSYRNVSGFSFRHSVVINEISKEVKELLKKAESISIDSTDPLRKAINDWQCLELGQLKYVFKN